MTDLRDNLIEGQAAHVNSLLQQDVPQCVSDALRMRISRSDIRRMPLQQFPTFNVGNT